MKQKPLIRLAVSVLVGLCIGAKGDLVPLSLESGVVLAWPTVAGNSYQPQWAADAGGGWSDLGSAMPGDGLTGLLYDAVRSGIRDYRVVEVASGSSIVLNGGFELGTGENADHWGAFASHPPLRISDDANGGSFSMRCLLANLGSAPSEGLLSQRVVAEGGTVVGGQSYDFSFWAKRVSAGPSYVQQYEVRWLDGVGGNLGGTGLRNFDGGDGVWAEVSAPGLVAPVETADAQIVFRIVTGAVEGGHGEVLIDDVALGSGDGGDPGETQILSVTSEAVHHLTWPSVPGTEYRPTASIDLATWSPIDPENPVVLGDGSAQGILVPRVQAAEFYRLEIPGAAPLSR
ncbi:hypothetical protein BH23VER1_BH23VER1_34950 [soil metagenome]